MSLKNINDSDFEQVVLQSDVPVIVDCGASWCSPCVLQTPIMEKCAIQHENKLKVFALDIDDCPAFVNRYRIRSVPSLLFFNKGVVVETKIGLTSLDTINAIIEDKLK